MFSATTTELSTTRPMQIIRPISDTRLMVCPEKYMKGSDMNIDSGIDRAITTVSRSRRRKNSSTNTARMPPCRPESTTCSRLETMVSPWMKIFCTSKGASAGSFSASSTSALTFSQTSTVLACDSLMTKIAIDSRPL